MQHDSQQYGEMLWILDFKKKFFQNCKTKKDLLKKSNNNYLYTKEKPSLHHINGEADLVRYDLNGNKSIIEHFTKNDIFGEAFIIVTTNNELSVEAKKL